jgi:soluble lytic murein transglycosylase-like protein
MRASRLLIAFAATLALPMRSGAADVAGTPAPLFKTPPPPIFRQPPAPLFAAVASRRSHPGPLSWYVPNLGGRGSCSATVSRYDGLIGEIADRYELEHALVKAVVRAESNFDPAAVSPKGALGLMQLMPGTAARHGVRNPFHPRDNIDGGCRELRQLLDRYDGNLPLALAAYNAGVQRVEDAGGVPPIAETREYLTRVLGYRAAYQRSRKAPAASPAL